MTLALKSRKYTSLRLIVDVALEDADIHERASLAEDLVGEVVKVKSGAYENLICGSIDSVEILP